jgi:membrane protease YdiL (CAAX protease family)
VTDQSLSERATAAETRARRALAIELVAVAALAVHSVALHSRVPRRVRIPANVGVAAAMIGAARLAGTTWRDLGLDTATMRRGARSGLLAATPIVLGAAVAVAVPGTRRLLADPRITDTTAGEAAFETLVRIPLETALSEELIFRGALLGIALTQRRAGLAVASSSLLFGLWHVYPTIGSVRRSARRGEGSPGTASVAAPTAGVVAATATAGAGLAWLRLGTGSVIAPALAHAALNMTSFAGVRATARRPISA